MLAAHHDTFSAAPPRGRRALTLALAAAVTVSLSGCAGNAASAGISTPAGTSSTAATSASPSAPAPTSAGSTGAPAGTPAVHAYQTYRNTRFGYAVQVPAAFTGGPPAPNGRGRTYRSRDGHTAVTASASPAARSTPAAAAARYASDLRHRGTLTASNLDSHASTFTVTGQLYGKPHLYIEYVHGVVAGHTAYTVVWTYPADKQATVKPWVRHSVQTLVTHS